MRKLQLLLALTLLLSLVVRSLATTPVCAITGNLTNLFGSAGKNLPVWFSYDQAQNAGGTIVPGGQRVKVTTDSNGNLPTSGGCLPSPGTEFCPPQGAYFYTQIGSGPPIKMQAKFMPSVDLNQLILENSDPPSIVTNIISGSSNCSVVNPGTGVAGPASLTCTNHNTTCPSLNGDVLVQGCNASVTNLGGGLNGTYPVTSAGTISGSATIDTATTVAGSTHVTLGSGSTFANGEGILIPGAGGATALSTPAIAGAATFQTAGCSSSNTYSYKIIALDGAGGYTAASSAATVSNGSTLSGTCSNMVTITPDSSTWAYLVYETSGPRVVGYAINTSDNINSTIQFLDIGQSIDLSGSYLPTSPTGGAGNDWLDTTITGGGGSTTITVANAATTQVTSAPALHDDAVIIRAAYASVPLGSGVKVDFPVGKYNIASPITLGAQSPSVVATGFHFEGTGRWGAGATYLQAAPSLAGLPVIRFQNTSFNSIDNFFIESYQGKANTGACLQQDQNNPGSGPGIGRLTVNHVICYNGSYGFGDAIVYSQSKTGALPANFYNRLYDVDVISPPLNAGLYIGAGNMYPVQVTDSHIQGGLYGVRMNGSTLSTLDTDILVTQGAGHWAYYLGPGKYGHDPLQITGQTTENYSGGVLYIDAGANGFGGAPVGYRVNFVNSAITYSLTGGGTAIDDESPNIGVRFQNAELGASGTDAYAFTFKGPAVFNSSEVFGTSGGLTINYDAALTVTNTAGASTIAYNNLGSGDAQIARSNLTGSNSGNYLDLGPVSGGAPSGSVDTGKLTLFNAETGHSSENFAMGRNATDSNSWLNAPAGDTLSFNLGGGDYADLSSADGLKLYSFLHPLQKHVSDLSSYTCDGTHHVGDGLMITDCASNCTLGSTTFTGGGVSQPWYWVICNGAAWQIF